MQRKQKISYAQTEDKRGLSKHNKSWFIAIFHFMIHNLRLTGHKTHSMYCAIIVSMGGSNATLGFRFSYNSYKQSN